MIDLAYIGLTIFSFTLLIAYVRGCALLGHEDSAERRGIGER